MKSSRLNKQVGATFAEYSILLALVAVVSYATIGSLGQTVPKPYETMSELYPSSDSSSDEDIPSGDNP